PFLDMSVWGRRLSEVELRVCRIKTPEKYGTGFLVGPDLILTCYHVMEPVIEGRISSDDVRLLFDYKKLISGETLPGVSYRLAKQRWREDASPPSEVDDLPAPKGRVPRMDELDHILLRTKEKPGYDEISGKGKPNARIRGWFD